MTEQQARDNSEKKINQLKELAEKLQIRVVAQTAITQGNIIKPVVYYIDEEDYAIDPPEPVAPGPIKNAPGTGHVSKLIEEKDAQNTDLPK